MDKRTFQVLNTVAGVGTCLLIAVLVVRPFLLLSTPPGYRHDWIWPVIEASLSHASEFALSAWSPQDLGSPNSYPSLAPFFLYVAWAGKWLGLMPSLQCFVMACAASAALGAAVAAHEGLRASLASACVCSLIYAGSLGFANQLIAGHYGDLVAYAAFPWFMFALFRQYRTPAPLWIALCCAAAAICTVEIQFLFLNAALLAIFAIVAWRVSAIVAAGWTLGFMMLVNAVTIVQTLHFGTDFGIFLHERAVLSWVFSQSAVLKEALYAGGYAPGYDHSMLTGSLAAVSGLAHSVVPIFLLGGAVLFRNRTFFFTLAVYVVGVLLLSGVKGLTGPLLAWLFIHVRAVSVFRELYHASQLVAFPLGFGTTAIMTGALKIRRLPLRFLACGFIALTSIAFAAGPLIGGIGKFITPYRFGPGERQTVNAAARRSGTGRIVLWPGQQPVRSSDTAVGVDPLAYYPLGDRWSLFSYNSGDVVALAADLLDQGNFVAARRLYRRMSVGMVVLRVKKSFGLPQITIARESIHLLKLRTFTPQTARLEIIPNLPLVYGAGEPIVVSGDYSRLLEKRYDASVLAFMRQHPAFLKTAAAYSLGPTDSIDRQIAFGCRSLLKPEASTVDSSIRNAWVAAYRYGYADATLATPLSNAIVTQSTEPAANAAHNPTLFATVDGIRDTNYVWTSGNLGVHKPMTATAIAGYAGKPRRHCSSVFHPSPQRGQVTILTFERSSPTSLNGVLLVRNGGTLVFTDAFHEGWKLTVDGNRVDERSHFMADGFANGWIIQGVTGIHRFTLRYEPQQLFITLVAVQIAGWMALISFAAFLLIDRKKVVVA